MLRLRYDRKRQAVEAPHELASSQCLPPWASTIDLQSGNPGRDRRLCRGREEGSRFDLLMLKTRTDVEDTDLDKCSVARLGFDLMPPLSRPLPPIASINCV